MNNRNAKSIKEATAFQEAWGEYVDAVIRTSKIPRQSVQDEHETAYLLAEAADEAAYEAMIATIDAYCAEKIAQAVSALSCGLPVVQPPTQPFFIQQPYRHFLLIRHIADSEEPRPLFSFGTLFDLIAALPTQLDWLRSNPAHSLSAVGIVHKDGREDTLFEIMHPNEEQQHTCEYWVMVTGKQL